MDKKSAQQLIENTFNAKFDESQFTLFIKNLLNDVEPKSNAYSGNYIWDDYKEHINTYKRIGKYTDPDGEALDILIVEVKTVTKLERARTTLRNFVIKHLSKFDKDYALVAFYSKEDAGTDWRFSFIKLEHQSYLDEEKQKVKTRKEFTPAKRYSFLVGEYEQAHTAKTQILPLLQNIVNNPTVEDIENAFSIEKVTDEFFAQYKDLYVKLFEHFENDTYIQAELTKANIDNARFTKKLLGQIVFLYFLQKKGWLGVPQNEHWGKGQKRFIQEMYDKSKEENQNFFKDYLQYLFYEALAKERNDENSFYKRFNCRIPFLNGGLFEAEYDWKNANITIPENLFRNTEKNKAGDIGTGVLDVFDRYNFTIKEDEPLDKEVAVDPEMLGKVFENMLDIVERKSKGAFYTPREIVHYMCQESLIHYLDNCLNSSPPFKEEYPPKAGEVVKNTISKMEVVKNTNSKLEVVKTSTTYPKREEVETNPPGEVVENLNNLPYLKTFRKKLRNNSTPAEATLWKLLQKKQLDGRKFRRQHSVANYILDFYCPSEKLAIELDGQGHFEASQAEYDYERDLFLKYCGIKVLRFENKWVWKNTEGLLQAIKNEFGWWATPAPPFKGGAGVAKADIETYIRNGHFALEHDQRVVNKGKETKDYKYIIPESIRKNADLIDKKLTDIRICDPAIGSGAFPVGLLHELVNAQLVIKPHLSKKYFAEKLRKNGIGPNDTNNSESRYVYRLKRHIIQESIYGVDIDASAIDIARLRLWLSLVVDEDDLDPIETLPNLDYKIVCGNSLIGMPETAMHDLNVEKELEALKEQFYDETNESKKKALRTQINNKIRELLDSAETFAGYKIDFDFKLFFSEVWHLPTGQAGEKGGFDVVIGNPPYLSISKVDYKNVLKKLKYETYATTGDLYVLFYENGYKILKPNGNLNLITSNKWINASYGSKTRKFFAKKTSPQILIDFARIRIFPNATVFVNILMLEKSKPTGNVDAVAIQGNAIPRISLSSYFEKNKIELSVKGEEIWKISSPKGLEINNKIENRGTPLMDWEGIEFFRGVTTGMNQAFHIDNEVAKELIAKNRKNKEVIVPLLRGKDIKRWLYHYKNWYMINAHNGIRSNGILPVNVKNEYPIIYEYLKKWETDLKKRKDKGEHWTNLRNCAFLEEFEKPKIVWIEISDKANYTYDDKGYYLTNSAYFLSGKNLKYLLAVLNSSIADYYFFQITAKIAGGRKRYTKQYVEKVPIPQISKKEQLPYELLVDYVISSKSLSDELTFNFFEQLLDAIVFELYFPEELKSAGKEILKHLSDLKPISSPPFEGVVSEGQGGQELTQEEKLAIIQSEFERLHAPGHPVRNAIETLDSIEEVRIIKEALK